MIFDIGFSIFMLATFLFVIGMTFIKQQKQLQKIQHEHELKIEELKYKHTLKLE